MGKEYVDGSGASVDISGDRFQGCNHYGFTGTTGPATGYPRSTEPRKTWLDECAMMAMRELIRISEPGGGIPIDKTCEMIADQSYKIATAMLAEKMKREAK
jgi:hypothetical protein